MPATKILIKRGTKSALDTLMQGPYKLLNGELAYTTDTQEVYISDGTQVYLVGRVITGDFTDRPAAGVRGRMFVVTQGSNLGKAYVDDGTSWVEVTPLDALKADITAQLDSIRSDLTSHIDNTSIHFVIDDSTTSTTSVWSSSKIRSAIDSAILGLSWREPAEDLVTNSQDVTPQIGEYYLIGENAVNDFSGHDWQIAQWTENGWVFTTPLANWAIFVKTMDAGFTYDAEQSKWIQFSTAISQYLGGDGIRINGNVIHADVDTSTIIIQSDKIALGDVAGDGLSGGMGSKLNLAFTANTHPFEIINGGLGIKIDGTTIDYDTGSGNQLYVKIIDCGEF